MRKSLHDLGDGSDAGRPAQQYYTYMTWHKLSVRICRAWSLHLQKLHPVCPSVVIKCQLHVTQTPLAPGF